jgi:hypothetical protein
MDITKFLTENASKGSFKPYTYFDLMQNTLSVYLKDEDYYVEKLDEDMDLFKSFVNKEEIVGCRLYLDGKFIRIIPDDFK